MIRNSIFFLIFFSFWFSHIGKSQDSQLNKINLTCFQRDYISWDLSIEDCPSFSVDSFQIHIKNSDSDPFTVIENNTDPSVREYRNEIIKSSEELFVKYFIRCSGENISLYSDTLSLPAVREAVELDTIEVLPDGSVSLSWEKIPVEGMSYIVKSIIDGSSHEISGTLNENSFVDSRKLANHEKVFYSISAYNSCNYNLPEPDEFYNTSLLSGRLTECTGAMEFEFEPFSFWKARTASRHLMIIQDGTLIDSVELPADSGTFLYDQLKNNESYTFYVLERSSAIKKKQTSKSNSVHVFTEFYEPIKWITIRDINIQTDNSAVITWETNLHDPRLDFVLYKDKTPTILKNSDLTVIEKGKIYQSMIPDFSLNSIEYNIGLQDSCGNEVLSFSKAPLITDGTLSGGLDLNIQWTGISDDEWRINQYHIFYKNHGSFSELSSVNGNELEFQHHFDENNPMDSLCYYIEAEGDLYFPEADSTATTKIRSNTVCLYGETIISLPNAFHPDGINEYKPIIAPSTNIRSYTMTIFDRYGNLIFKTHDLEEGWNGYHSHRRAFSDTYVILVELENNNGEKWKESGSLLLLH